MSEQESRPTAEERCPRCDSILPDGAERCLMCGLPRPPRPVGESVTEGSAAILAAEPSAEESADAGGHSAAARPG